MARHGRSYVARVTLRSPHCGVPVTPPDPIAVAIRSRGASCAALLVDIEIERRVIWRRRARGTANVRRAPPELLVFLSAFPPSVSKLFLATRRLVLDVAPGANELVYDAYNAVSSAYTFSDRLKEAFCHVAAYPTHVNLGFAHRREFESKLRFISLSASVARMAITVLGHRDSP